MQTSRNSRPRKRSGRATRRVPIEALEPRLCMALSVGWDGPGRGGTALNYYIGAVPASLNAAQVESALTTALNAWSAVADIRFTRTSVPQQLDSLDFTFRAIDGAGRALAQGYLPDDVNPARIAGDIQFDSAESWEIGNARGNAAFDLTLVAVHEIGHALGLDHINAADSVMRPSVSASQTFAGLGASDQSAILALYAAADGNSDTPTTPETPTTPTTPTPRRTPPFGRRGRFGRAEGAPEAPHQLFSASSRWQNGENASDVNGDESVTPNDVLRIVNRLNSSGARPLGDDDAATTDFVDCNGDSQLSPLDALIVINSLNSPADAGKSETPTPTGDPADTAANAADASSGEDGLGTDAHSGSERLVNVLFQLDANEDGVLTADKLPDRLWQYLVTADTNADGGLSMEELAAFRPEGEQSARADLFARFDENDDGLLTEGELPARIWERLLDADTDGDAAVSVDELAAFRAAQLAEKVAAFIGRFDDNADEMLTEDELPARWWDRLNEAGADTNADGAISAAELTDVLPSLVTEGGHHRGHHRGRGFRRGRR